MIEATIKSTMEADATLTGLLSSFNSSPAVFSSIAPEAATMPYIVMQIGQYDTVNPAVKGFDVEVYVYDSGHSGAVMRSIAERIEFIFDYLVSDTDERFDNIRFRFVEGREIENSDTEVQRYLCRLTARAGRKKWAQETL